MSERPAGDPRGRGADEVVRSQYDWESITPSTAVVETVAAATNREQSELGTLYDFLDPDALNTLIRQGGSAGILTNTTVSFTFEGQRVSIHRTGEIVVEPAGRRTDL